MMNLANQYMNAFGPLQLFANHVKSLLFHLIVFCNMIASILDSVHCILENIFCCGNNLKVSQSNLITAFSLLSFV